MADALVMISGVGYAPRCYRQLTRLHSQTDGLMCQEANCRIVKIVLYIVIVTSNTGCEIYLRVVKLQEPPNKYGRARSKRFYAGAKGLF